MTASGEKLPISQIFSWNPCKPAHGRSVGPAVLWPDRRHQSWTWANSTESESILFSITFGFCCLYVQAASWAHLAELFQERLEHVLKQYMKVILSTH